MADQTCGRIFTGSVEAIAQVWRGAAKSEDTWKESTGARAGEAGGETQGYYVTCGPLNAFAKPSKVDASVPRAAHEKIAADLAFDLKIAIPPALLWEWPKPPIGDQPLVVLSLIPFLPAHKWQVVKAVPELEASLKQELRIAASGLVAFDTWVGNTDRPNDGNLLVSKDRQDAPGTTRAAYIDYSYSMSHVWRNKETPAEKVTPVAMFPTDASHLDRGLLRLSSAE